MPNSPARNRQRETAAPPHVAIFLIALLVLLLPALTGAQEPPEEILIGQVVHEGVPVPAIPVTLHRVTSQGSGELAETVTNADGQFRFPLRRLAASDFNVFFVTAEYLSVRYFGNAIHPDEARDEYSVVVYDTTSVIDEPIRIVRRDMVIIPEETGSWEVNEVIRILNPGSAALVAGAGAPTWEFRIPESAGEFQAGEGDILPHEVSLMGNRVLLLTPMIPGSRDLFIRYRLPSSPSQAVIPLDQPTDSLSLFVQQPSHLSGVEGLSTTRMVEVEGQQFLQYSGDSFLPSSEVVLTWSRAGSAPFDPVSAAVAVTILLLAVGAGVAFRNRSALPT